MTEAQSSKRTEGKAKPFVRRQAQLGWVGVNFAELWQYRELLVFQALRDIKVRYKQTALGAAWAILQPVLTMVVFSIFFGNLAGIPSDGVPLPDIRIRRAAAVAVI